MIDLSQKQSIVLLKFVTAKTTFSLKKGGLGINITLHTVLLACQYLSCSNTMYTNNASGGGCECQQELADLRRGLEGRVSDLETQLSKLDPPFP